jgi:chondroitin AC lyase
MRKYFKMYLLLGLLTFFNNTANAQLSLKDGWDEMILVRKRIIAELMKGGVNDQQVRQVISTYRSTGDFSDIDYSDLSTTAGFPHQKHLSNLYALAKAYQTNTSVFFHDAEIMKEIEGALNYWVEKDYIGDNWHDNQITTPTWLVNLLLIMGNDLKQDLAMKTQKMIGRANLNASGARPSGDRIVIAGILARNLIYLDSLPAFEKVIKVIEGEIKFSTGERGMQHDYSFHHRVDRVNNTTSYGYGKYANAFGEWSFYVSGTRYQFSKEKINQLVDYYIDGISKQQVYGIYEDVSVKNRDITSKSYFQPKGILEIERLLMGTDHRKAELEELIKLRKGEIRPSRSFAKFFWQTEHFVFQRPHFYTTVRMFSTRNQNMEMPYNGPGKPTHHRADGTNYLFLKGDEYHNIWPVYDWQKISGTTVLQKPKLHGPQDIQKKGLTSFVGAVTDGLYGAVAFDFRSPHDGVEAKKSWFFFDEEYVCLGTDIRSEVKLPVATTINQALLKGPVRVMQDDKQIVLPEGNRKLEKLKWVHHNSIGYLFPSPASLELSNQVATGTWASITDQKNISTALVQEPVFNLWFNHGNSPANASYQYIVVPAIDVDVFAANVADNRQIQILSNTGSIQAVWHGKKQMLQSAFYRAGTLKVKSGIQVRLDSQGMVMLKAADNRIISVTVADPSRMLQRINLTISGVYQLKKAGVICMPDTGKKETMMVIDLPQDVWSGSSVTIEF